MIGCLQTCVCKQPIVALYFEFENELKVYNLEARQKYCYLTSSPGDFDLALALLLTSNIGVDLRLNSATPVFSFLPELGNGLPAGID